MSPKIITGMSAAKSLVVPLELEYHVSEPQVNEAGMVLRSCEVFGEEIELDHDGLRQHYEEGDALDNVPNFQCFQPVHMVAYIGGDKRWHRPHHPRID